MSADLSVRRLPPASLLHLLTYISADVIAHPDDDLLFQSPTLLDDVQGGDCITTVILTAGDSGTGLDYAESREAGNQAAYAQMAGVDDSHTEFYATFGGQPVLIRTLVAAPQVQKVYFRLPDGNMDGSGFSATGFQSIRSLYFGTIPSITNLPGDATFTLDTLKEAIAQILAARQPDRVRTLDHLSDYSAGDHADHLTAGRITSELVGSYAPAADFAGYMGYPVQNLAPTMSQDSAEFAAKCDAFFAYTPFDYAECQSFAACAGRGESSWLQREYAVTPDLATTTSGDGTAQTPVTLPDGENLASRATATASSYSEGSPPSAAIDGVLGGYPTDDSAEWVSDHEGVGAWLKLEWDTTVTITAIAIYDRPNLVDWLTTGTLTASDGAEISFTNTVNDGSAFLVTLPQGHSTTSLLLTVTGVSSGTENVGLSELQGEHNPLFRRRPLADTLNSQFSVPATTARRRRRRRPRIHPCPQLQAAHLATWRELLRLVHHPGPKLRSRRPIRRSTASSAATGGTGLATTRRNGQAITRRPAPTSPSTGTRPSWLTASCSTTARIWTIRCVVCGVLTLLC